MKLSEVLKTERESEQMFRQLVMKLTEYADSPFKKEIWHGKPNPWHMSSGTIPRKGKITQNFMNVHLINDEGENYVELMIVVPNDSERGRALLQFVSDLSVILPRFPKQNESKFLNDQGGTQLYVKVYEL